MFLVPQTCMEHHEVRETAQPPEPPPDGGPSPWSRDVVVRAWP